MMTNLQKFLTATEFKITGGSEYCWNCFGTNARYLDSDREDRYSVGTIFDSKDQTVYVMEAWDYVNDRVYRWINPDYRQKYIDEHKERNVDFYETIDNSKFIDLEIIEDFLSKANAIVNGVEYDNRVSVPIDLSDQELLDLFKMAHERDITFNQLAEEILTTALKFPNNSPGVKDEIT